MRNENSHPLRCNNDILPGHEDKSGVRDVRGSVERVTVSDEARTAGKQPGTCRWAQNDMAQHSLANTLLATGDPGPVRSRSARAVSPRPDQVFVPRALRCRSRLPSSPVYSPVPIPRSPSSPWFKAAQKGFRRVKVLQAHVMRRKQPLEPRRESDTLHPRKLPQ